MISSWKIYQTHTTQGAKLISRDWCESWDTPGWGSDTTYSNEISLAKLFCFLHWNIWQQHVFLSKKKKYLGGYSISLISHPDVYVPGSSSLLGEGRVPDDGPEMFPVVPGGSWCGSAGPRPVPVSPGPSRTSPSLPAGPMGSYRPGARRKVTRAIYAVPSTLSALNKL